MIIQNANVNYGAPAARYVSDDSPRVVASNVAGASEHVDTRQPSLQQLDNAVNAVNHAMQQSNQSLEFSVDPDTQRSIIRMVDTSTGELVRQIPSKEMLAIAQSIDQFLHRQGLLLNQKA